MLFGGFSGEQDRVNDVYIIDLHTMVITFCECLTLNLVLNHVSFIQGVVYNSLRNSMAWAIDPKHSAVSQWQMCQWVL